MHVGIKKLESLFDPFDSGITEDLDEVAYGFTICECGKRLDFMYYAIDAADYEIQKAKVIGAHESDCTLMPAYQPTKVMIPCPSCGEDIAFDYFEADCDYYEKEGAAISKHEPNCGIQKLEAAVAYSTQHGHREWVAGYI